MRAAGIGAADAESLSEAEFELRVFGPTTPTKANALVTPDCAWIHNELKRHRHVTLALEEQQQTPAMQALSFEERVALLIDWGLTALSAQDRADLLEILDDRVNTGSTLVASQRLCSAPHNRFDA